MGDHAAADLSGDLPVDLPTDLPTDLTARWRPSVSQVAMADALLAIGVGARSASERGVHTAHLLINKTFSFWDAGVRVVSLAGVFVTVEGAWGAGRAALRAHRATSGAPATSGWTWHHGRGEWAVFEDLASIRLPGD